MQVSRKLKEQKRKWSEEREDYLYRKHSFIYPERVVSDPQFYNLSKRERRQRLEGSGNQRREMLDYIYKRDKGICYSCGEWMPRRDATREHLFRPMADYPHLARDPMYMALAHKECNK